MATKTEMLIEANRRGLLTGDRKAQFDEAVRRGLINLPVEQMADEQVGNVQFASPEAMSQHARKALETVQYPSEPNSLGAFWSGARRGMENIGQGILQRAAELGDFLGMDTEQFQQELSQTGRIREQQTKPTREEYPIATGVGEIAGTIAGFPYAPSSVPKAIAAGAAFGAAQPSDSGKETALNIVQDAALGGLGAWAAPYIQRGFNKSQAMFSGLYKKATGADPRPEMFDTAGNLTDQGKSAMQKIGINENDFARLYEQLDKDLDPIASTRIARAQEQGIPLSTAQATKDFAGQEAEQTLRASVSREGAAARQAEQRQQEAILGAQERFERGFGDVTDRQSRGANVQQALRDMQEQGRQNVSELYTKAKETAGTGSALDNNSLLDTVDELVIDRPVTTETMNTLESALAKFGLVDGEVSKAGRFTQVTDAEGKKIRFKGEQTPLTLDNAEELRQKLNTIRGSDTTGAVGGIINKLDDLVDSAVNNLPAGSAKTDAFQAARQAAREQKQIFSQKDIIQNLVGYKKNTQTDLIQPDRVIDSIIKGANAKGNLQKVKSTLMNNPTNKTVDAWKSIQAQGVADIFGQSINPATGEVSGQRLMTAIKRFGGGSEKEGRTRLKILLGDKYNEFDNLVSAIGDATIPIKGTTNPSGTAYKLLNFMTRVGTVGTFGADAVMSIASKAKDAATARRVLRRLETATPEKVQQAVKANDEMVDAYIRLGLTGTLRDQN
ncbi:hypothetical protein [Vibrio diazotrophicus]|uniref:hypothetical protein n=1 Tax=Vibrio diazotrophicus TaxID=685 RepID=UPI000C9E0B42|nr:hypothetical protein [Vibrio diazotrophicus]PNH94094.1 hypothetical protein C1M59_05035 [Vibrio diazotrophicus]